MLSSHVSLHVMCRVLLFTWVARNFVDGICFGRLQAPLFVKREQSGLGIHTSVPEHLMMPLGNGSKETLLEPTKSEKQLMSQLADAGRNGQWKRVKTLIGNYSGYTNQVLNAGMQAAYRCGEYEFSERLYRRMCEAGTPMDIPTITMAVQLFAKLRQTEMVHSLWNELVEADAIGPVEAAARMDAAAEEADIDTACDILDYMLNRSVKVDTIHFNLAMNACARSQLQWKHKAATYLFSQLLCNNLHPTIVTFTTLVRAHDKNAEPEILLQILSNMTKAGVAPNAIFAENFLYVFLRQREKGCWTSVKTVLKDIAVLPDLHLQRAQEVLEDFKRQGLKLTAGSRKVELALRQLSQIQ